jgi:hypothetical protein
MNDSLTVNKKSKIPKPKAFAKPRLSDLAKQLTELPIYDEVLGNELVLRNVVDPRLSSRIHQMAKGAYVSIKITTRFNPEDKTMRVYRLA